MENRQIKFSENWNNKFANRIFTTIRKGNAKKRRYYVNNIGEKFSIVMNDYIIGTCVLRDVKERRFSSIDDVILMLDTGTNDVDKANQIFENFKIDRSDNVLILIFENLFIKI